MVVVSFQSPDAPAGGDSSDPSKLCTKEGYVRDPNDQRIFYQCRKFSEGFTATRLECPPGLVFDLSVNVCNWADAVKN
jgi:chitinase